MSSLQALRIRPRRDLRSLASFEAKDGIVLSLYVGFDASVTRTGDETATRIASLLEQVTRASEAVRLEHDARLAFGSDIGRARDEVWSRLGPAGVVCFADSADGLWHVEERFGLPDLAKVQSSPYLVPLVAAPAEERVLVALVGRQQGEVFELRGGRMSSSPTSPRISRDGTTPATPGISPASNGTATSSHTHTCAASPRNSTSFCAARATLPSSCSPVSRNRPPHCGPCSQTRQARCSQESSTRGPTQLLPSSSSLRFRCSNDGGNAPRTSSSTDGKR